MGAGKLALGLVMLGVLAFGLISGFSIAKTDQSTDSFYKNASTVNGTVGFVENMAGAGSNLIAPIVLVFAIITFCAFLLIFRKVT